MKYKLRHRSDGEKFYGHIQGRGGEYGTAVFSSLTKGLTEKGSHRSEPRGVCGNSVPDRGNGNRRGPEARVCMVPTVPQEAMWLERGEPRGQWQARRVLLGPLWMQARGWKVSAHAMAPSGQAALQEVTSSSLGGFGLRGAGPLLSWDQRDQSCLRVAWQRCPGLLVCSGWGEVGAGEVRGGVLGNVTHASRKVACVCLPGANTGTVSAFRAEPESSQHGVSHLATHLPCPGLLVPVLLLILPTPLPASHICFADPPTTRAWPTLQAFPQACPWILSHPLYPVAGAILPPPGSPS